MRLSFFVVRHGGGHLAHLLDADVSGGINARDGGLHLLVGYDIAVLEGKLGVQLGVGGHTGVHKDAAAGVLNGLNGAIPLAGDLQALYLILPVDSVEAGAQFQGDVARGGHLLPEFGDTAQLVLKVDDGQLAGKGGQVQSLFHCAVGAAHHVDILSGVGGSVPGSVQAHALAGKLSLAGNAQLAGRAAVGKNHPAGLIAPLIGVNGLYLTGQIHAGDRLISDLHACIQRLLLHAGGKGGARFMGLEGGIVGDRGHLADDAAHLGLLQNQGFISAADRIDARADAGWAGADDQNVIHNGLPPIK